MSGFDVQLQGEDLRRVKAQLSALEDNIKERAIRSGLVAVASPIKRTAKSLAPKESGDMAKAVGHLNINKRQRSRLGFKAGEVGILIGTNRKIRGRWQGKKGMWHEYGTEHMDANPFLEPAMSQNQGGTQKRFYDGLSKYLDRQRKKGAI
ncbi:HK97-gp10 family putative phage morphogenesis protein [Halomonas halocynthiae]|uniref:HK97-gp10 family putative phage morphogenesis protein n=1 Tax=Halomonas halocynthiae TaxID=176290 RepID=UPI00041E49DF|nr:HK97-gp10 family putative phage morphogenesis protein [Halomonas halocynthiae]